MIQFRSPTRGGAEGRPPPPPEPGALEALGDEIARLSAHIEAATHRLLELPAALRRALDARDGGCRFPGCGLRFTDAHHIVHWADGGETKLPKLVLLCRRHHRAVHEDRVRIEGVPGPARCPAAEDGEEGLRFYRPDGRPLPEVPGRPAVPERPAEALAAGNRRRGITIDRFTATPRWLGEPLDLRHAIATLRRSGTLRWTGSRPHHDGHGEGPAGDGGGFAEG